MAWSIFKKLLLLHLAFLTIITVISANNHHYKRYIQTNNYRLNTQSTYDTSKLTNVNNNHDDNDNDNNNNNNSDNNITLKPEKKITHGLMGGHIKVESIVKNINNEKNNDDNDGDEAKWDDGLFLSSAGNGKETKSRRAYNNNYNYNNKNNYNNNNYYNYNYNSAGSNRKNKNNDDEKKTLAQQVKEGKYGLIQNEIYLNKPKRPGIISYLSNPDVPKDNAKNFGGLDKDDIWLAENHMLVIKGGNYHGYDDDNDSNGDLYDWPPIDNYQAPKRQVRIPLQPKVPPPFPIQLIDDGPIKIIGNTNDTILDNNENIVKWIPEGLISFNDTALAESNPENNTNTNTNNNNEYLIDRRTKSELTLGGIVGPFFPSLPPGAVFVPPPNNQTDYDEDDQSIYYPPPYSFKYSQDNSTVVPPGPLVPGIILPPPPDFFSQLEEKKISINNNNKNKCSRCTTSSSSSSSKTSHYNSQKSSTKPYKIYSSTVASTKITRRPFTMKPINKFKHKTIINSPLTESVTESLYTDVTTPSTNSVNTLEISDIDAVQPILNNNQVVESRTEEKKSHWHTSIASNKSKPIVAYYPTTSTTRASTIKIKTKTKTTSTTSTTEAAKAASTTVPPNIYEHTIEATPASVKNIIPTSQRPGSLASYYFYEEANDEMSGTTENPTVYYRETSQTPSYYHVDNLVNQQRQTTKHKPYYNIEITPSEQTSHDYSVEIIEPIVKTSPKYQYTNGLLSSTKNLGVARAQGHRMLSNTSPIYYEDITERPHLNFQSFFTTPSTRGFTNGIQSTNKYNDKIKSKPVYQYSYEATNYSNQRERQQQQPIYKPDVQVQQQQQQQQPQQQRQQEPKQFNKWQEIEEENEEQQIYDYNTAIELPEDYDRDKNNYHDENLSINYPTSTIRSSIINTTPNPSHAYYTKQDEQFFDDVTKEYFTNFGKKIVHQRLESTTPIYGKNSNEKERDNYSTRNSFVTNDYEERSTVTYKPPRVKVHYGDQSQTTYSLEDDTRVNYQQPLPSINPDAEYLPGYGPKSNEPIVQQHQAKPSSSYPYRQPNFSNQQQLVPIINYNGEQITQQQQPGNSPTNFVSSTENTQSHDNQNIYPASRLSSISLAGDIAVNYRHPRPQINPDAEFINSATGQVENSGNANSYFAYRLPGDSGHVYFLTPHAINQRQDGNIDGRYLNTQSSGSRRVRRRRGPKTS